MSTEATTTPATTPAVSEPKKDLLSTINETSIKAAMSIEMQRGKFEDIKQKVANLNYTTNPEDFKEVEDVCVNLKKLKDAIATQHATGKEPYWKICKLYDKVKNDYTGLIDSILLKPESERIRLTKEIEEKVAKEKAEQERIDRIKDAIAKNILYYTETFTKCETRAELVTLQSSINLQRTRTKDFQEFLPEYIEQLDNMNTIINEAKERVEKIESLQNTIATEMDDDKKLEAEAKLQEVQEEKDEVALKTLENSLNVSTQVRTVHATTVLPNAGAKKRVLKCKITDAAKALKNHPELVEVILKPDAVKALMDSLKAEKKISLDMKVAYELQGISFFVDKVY